jgi:uncharacterized protein YggT (Ycf19 family)
MALIDFILNVVALLLWVNWRSLGMPSAVASPGISLLATLKRAEHRPVHRWRYLAGLGVLLLARPLAYWLMGASVNWTARLELGAVSLYFRADLFERMAIYSTLGFLRFLALFYFSLLLLSALNHNLAGADSWLRLIRFQLGPLGRLPCSVQLLLPPLLAALLWMALSGWLVRAGVLAAPRHATHMFQQAGVLGLSSLLAWKFTLMAVLALHVVNSYVYVGNHSFWSFVTATARRVLWPVRWLPLTVLKFDFAPLLLLVLIGVVAYYGEQGLTRLYSRLPL